MLLSWNQSDTVFKTYDEFLGRKSNHIFDYYRLPALGIGFSVKPAKLGAVKIAVFNDSYGINI